MTRRIERAKALLRRGDMRPTGSPAAGSSQFRCFFSPRGTRA